MAQAVVGKQAVADQGLDKLAVREALVEVWLFVASLVLQLALVYNVLRRGGVAHDDAEMPRGVVPRLHRHVSDEVDSGLVERLENLLHIPDGAVLPLALGTVLNRDLRVFVHAGQRWGGGFFRRRDVRTQASYIGCKRLRWSMYWDPAGTAYKVMLSQSN